MQRAYLGLPSRITCHMRPTFRPLTIIDIVASVAFVVVGGGDGGPGPGDGGGGGGGDQFVLNGWFVGLSQGYKNVP